MWFPWLYICVFWQECGSGFLRRPQLLAHMEQQGHGSGPDDYIINRPVLQTRRTAQPPAQIAQPPLEVRVRRHSVSFVALLLVSSHPTVIPRPPTAILSTATIVPNVFTLLLLHYRHTGYCYCLFHCCSSANLLLRYRHPIVIFLSSLPCWYPPPSFRRPPVSLPPAQIPPHGWLTTGWDTPYS